MVTSLAFGCGDGEESDRDLASGGSSLGGGSGATVGIGGEGTTGGQAGAAALGGAVGLGGVGGSGAGGNPAAFVPASPVQALVPLVPGRVLTYELSALYPDYGLGTCDSPLGVFGEVGEYQGHQGVWYDSPCQTILALLAYEGEDITAYGDGILPEMRSYLLSPLAETTEWNGMAWRYVGELTVPAGTFTDCWDRTRLDREDTFFTYCTGVGLVALSDKIRNLRAELARID
ncbi:MAG: hypothetical protein JW751_06870, partial [Polyangiaceae bacterium]|nr:hypothetical protein [Polyangiaceae bacterium]